MPIFDTRRSAFRLLLTALVVSSLATSCKNRLGSDSDVDPRDQYVGTYEGGVSTALNVGGFESTPQTGTATISIMKGQNAKEIYIDTNMSLGRPTPLKVTAELNGNNFTIIDRNRDQVNVLGKVLDGDFKGTGVFDNNQVVISTTTETVQGGRVVRSETITGTRK